MPDRPADNLELAVSDPIVAGRESPVQRGGPFFSASAARRHDAWKSTAVRLRCTEPSPRPRAWHRFWRR